MSNKKMPLYQKIMKNIQDYIKNQGLEHGDVIPTEKALSEKYQVSRVTIRKAISRLIEKEILYSIKGSGTYVAFPKFEHNLFKLQGFTEEMQPYHDSIKNKVIEFRLIKPNEEIQEILNLNKEEKVYNIKRIRKLNGEVLIIENAYIPFELFPDLSVEAMTKSKYGYLKEKGYVIKKRVEEFIPRLPSEDTMEIFNIKSNTPLLELRAHSILSNDEIFEYSEVLYHPKKYKFKLELSR
ncbi:MULTISPECIES: GntR family transcriptional regulator [Mammaliicoccus]|uniref:GntR family transcriptional regulator n=3 Tax=Mammaliicoccus lentus TaxID=42858 RepID=A0ABS6GVU3_MAMLE|nr:MULTISPECIES: GntR family transcriptional regulator [Mammaliicoccus]MBF0749974.1 GntR family transcriptional regulator [Mammaliicoccus lentus]MBF0840913.1 GntR family transcriptional regulator [Mammaliicoccus lentus]MBU6113575.1 GntR family transcriptional regulator [Mammaliicoccus lentus]MCR1873232.1 GntR family transcriptional regulator [Mammaliicoccus lentus]MEB5685110.1 GntR family transcriptional regulator [Mammaliicoccus lentus]